MSELPDDLMYSKSHEWVRVNDDGSMTIGITDHAQDQLGDMVYVEVPEQGAELKAGEACAVAESVKAASDVYAPISGTVIEGNGALEDSPEVVNQDAFGEGWLMKVQAQDADVLNELMSAVDYRAYIEAEDN